jgi:hypothetical protein
LAHTLADNATDESIVSEILLRAGVRLDLPWVNGKLGKDKFVISGNVMVVLAREITQSVLDAVFEEISDVSTIVFLEDAFANHDAEKANAHFAFKRLNKQMKTV